MEYPLLLEEEIWIGIISFFSCFIAYYTIPVIIRAAEKKHLFDHPDNDRKLHSEAIPTLGGIAIFVAFLLSFSLSPGAGEFSGYSYLVGALLILFFVGLKDDLVVLSARKKLFSQIVAAGLVIFGSGLTINNFQGVLGIYELPTLVSSSVTFLTIIVVINAVNLIDGIDGLAGGIGALASIFFGVAFIYVGQLPMAIFSFSLAGALVGFLFYNFSPASIFMGDTGSMILGFLLSVQAISFLGLSEHPAFFELFGNAAPVLTVSILAFPLFDTLRVVFKRLRRNRSIFEPGQDHVHHELLRMGLSHRKASLILYFESFGLVTVMAILSTFDINVNVLLGIMIVGSLIVYPTNGTKRKIMAKLFGYDWQKYRRQKWGIEFDHHNITPLNGNDKKIEDAVHTSIEEREEIDEMDSMAV